MNLNDLRENFKDNGFIPYVEFLKTQEWKQKRDEILRRDNYTCLDCGKRETIEHYDEKLRKNFHFSSGEDEIVSVAPGVEASLPKLIFQDKAYHLEVHHKIYILNRLPWQYENDKLSTLCNWCHWKFHENNQVTGV